MCVRVCAHVCGGCGSGTQRLTHDEHMCSSTKLHLRPLCNLWQKLPVLLSEALLCWGPHCRIGVLTAGSGSSLPGLDPHCRVGSGSVLPGRGPHPLYSSVLPYLKCSDMSLFSINMNWLSANLNKGRGTRQLILVEHEGLMQWCHSVSDWFTRWS